MKIRHRRRPLTCMRPAPPPRSWPWPVAAMIAVLSLIAAMLAGLIRREVIASVLALASVVSVVQPLSAAERAELAALRRLRAPVGDRGGVEPLGAFIQRMSPQFTAAPHLQPLIRLIERSRQEEIRAVVIYPPRHGKTETIAHGLAWRILCDPAGFNAYATYGNDLSIKASRRIRKLVLANGMPLAKDRNTVNEWKTPVEGGLKATSLGGPLTGQGFKGGLIVVDDPIKGRKAANSRKVRDEVWDWLCDDVLSRAEGGTSVIVNATRWHEDDPTGRILAGKLNALGHGPPWEVIHMPAVMDADGKPTDERINPDARVLWPASEWTLERFAGVRARGEHGWWSLYQGMPRSRDGKLFPGEPNYFALGEHRWDGTWRAVLVLDPAASESTSADWSAIGLFAMQGYGLDSRMRVIRARRVQQSIPDVAMMALAWQRQYGVMLAIEAQGAFVSVPQTIRKAAPGLRIYEIKKRGDGDVVWLGDKFTRAQPASGAWKDPKGNRIAFPIGEPWVSEFVDELHDFTGLGDAHDDQVDILAHAWNVLYRETPSSPDLDRGSVEVVGA